jgi:hypothetical protein
VIASGCPPLLDRKCSRPRVRPGRCGTVRCRSPSRDLSRYAGPRCSRARGRCRARSRSSHGWPAGISRHVAVAWALERASAERWVTLKPTAPQSHGSLVEPALVPARSFAAQGDGRAANRLTQRPARLGRKLLQIAESCSIAARNCIRSNACVARSVACW